MHDRSPVREAGTTSGRIIESWQPLAHVIRSLGEFSFVSATQSTLRTLPPDSIDTLTHLPNHRAFRESMALVRGQCRRQNAAVAMLLADLDGFAVLNETHSHSVGDQVLRWVGTALRRRCRPCDFVARYDWDQFAAYLPGCSEAEALAIAERCRREWRRRPPWLNLLPAELRVSVGVAALGAGFLESEQTLIRMAGAALLEAKRLGGDRTQGWSSLAGQASAGPGSNGHEILNAAALASGHAQDCVRQTYMESARALVAAVETKDPYTRDHSLRVSHYAEGLARRLRLPPEEIETLRTAAVLHDVGKIGIPDEILRKPGPLTADEYTVVKRHPAAAVAILEHASFFRAELPLILHHHEWFNGGGYPSGLAGEAIPFGARILAVADCTDAMLSPRSYKSGYSLERVRRELVEFGGRQFDPRVAQVVADWMSAAPRDFVEVQVEKRVSST